MSPEEREAFKQRRHDRGERDHQRQRGDHGDRSNGKKDSA
jgi:hypothetical protein